jgi:hypothetical protein
VHVLKTNLKFFCFGELVYTFVLQLVYTRGRYIRMPMKQRALKVDDTDWAAWTQKAESSGLSIGAWIRERCNSEDVRRVPELPVEGRGVVAPERPTVNVDDVGGLRARDVKRYDVSEVSYTKSRTRKSEFAESVAGRTGHIVGCDCFQCVQAGRFFKSVSKED